jgi:S-adenosylmethionine hydrolase
VITFEQVGADRGQEVVVIPYQHPAVANGVAAGGIPILDVQYGNVWTNVDSATFEGIGAQLGEAIEVRIFNGKTEVVALTVTYAQTFAGVGEGEPLLYMNSLGNAALAINLGSFAERFGISSGPEWTIRLKKP